MTDLPPSGVLLGRAACTALLRQLLCDLGAPPADIALSATGAPGQPGQPLPREALICDVDFAAWPLDDPAVLRRLASWLRPAGRRLTIVVRDVDATARLHPLFARWRRDWAHRIAVWQPVDGLLAPGLRLLLAGTAAAQWLEAPDWRLRLITDSVHLAALHEQCADFLQRCEPAWPVTTLGL
jgi:hypothetical protein